MIAEAMVRSVTEIPHAWSTKEVDVTGLVSLRRSVRGDFERREGVAPHIYAFRHPGRYRGPAKGADDERHLGRRFHYPQASASTWAWRWLLPTA